jgi:hypothetical protein
VTVILEVPVTPVTTETVVGLAVTVNAVPTVNLTEADRVNPLPVPVTVTLKVPERTESEHVRIELREVVVVLNAKLAGLSTQVNPRVGETVSLNVTVPVKP